VSAEYTSTRKLLDEEGICASVDPELFYPESMRMIYQIAEAKKICSLCPVQDACLNLALVYEDGFGIYGGATLPERDAMRADLGITTKEIEYEEPFFKAQEAAAS
jgi:WhiB family transcriptional regulator, redox-sensing transcriptional regulator